MHKSRRGTEDGGRRTGGGILGEEKVGKLENNLTFGVLYVMVEVCFN